MQHISSEKGEHRLLPTSMWRAVGGFTLKKQNPPPAIPTVFPPQKVKAFKFKLVHLHFCLTNTDAQGGETSTSTFSIMNTHTHTHTPDSSHLLLPWPADKAHWAATEAWLTLADRCGATGTNPQVAACNPTSCSQLCLLVSHRAPSSSPQSLQHFDPWGWVSAGLGETCSAVLNRLPP